MSDSVIDTLFKCDAVTCAGSLIYDGMHVSQRFEFVASGRMVLSISVHNDIKSFLDLFKVKNFKFDGIVEPGNSIWPFDGAVIEVVTSYRHFNSGLGCIARENCGIVVKLSSGRAIVFSQSQLESELISMQFD